MTGSNDGRAGTNKDVEFDQAKLHCLAGYRLAARKIRRVREHVTPATVFR